MGFKHYGVKTGGIPVDYIKRFTERYDIPVFIETGTAGGESVRAVAPLFKECHTIEIVDHRPDGFEYPSNVKLHAGDSAKLLKEIAEPYKGRNILFWLDAHWSEPFESPGGTNECPVMDEIQALHGHRGIVMIDDARLFYGRPPWPCNPEKGWPRFMHVFEKLRQCFPDNIVTIIDDYIVSFPHDMREVANQEWYERYTERFPHEDEKLKQSVIASFEALMLYMR